MAFSKATRRAGPSWDAAQITVPCRRSRPLFFVLTPVPKANLYIESEMSTFDQPAPDATPEHLASELVLSGRQIAVLRLIERFNAKLGPIYRGALETLAEKRTDYIALAAHGFRELMEKAVYWSGEKKLPTMKVKFNDLKDPWEAVLAAEKAGTIFTNEKTLKPFLDRFRGFYDWVNESLPSRKKQAGIVLRRLQKKREDPTTFANDQKAWQELHECLTNISHHRLEVTEAQLLSFVNQLEILLLKYLRPVTAEKLNAIDRITISAAATPSKQHLEDIKHLIDGWADRDAFLSSIQEWSWISLLMDDGWFNPSSANGPQVEDPSPGYREAELLARFVKTRPVEVDQAARQLSLINDERVHRRILEIAAQLPCDLSRGYVEYAKQWAANTHVHIVHESLERFILTLLNCGISAETLDLLEIALQFRPDERAEEKRAEREVEGPMAFMVGLDANPRWEVHQYKSLTETMVRFTQPDDSIQVLSLFCETLAHGIDCSIWPGETGERSGNDGSTYWRPAIEPHEQNHDDGHKEQLVSGIRDLAERIVANEPSKLAEVDSLLAAQPWLVFKRLRLHLYRLFPEAAGDRITGAILNTDLRDSDAWHEWALLLREQFKNASEQVQAFILDWIDTGFDPRRWIEWFQQNNDGRPPDDAFVMARKKAWQRQRLSLIADHLPFEWKTTYEKIRAKHGDAEHPEFHHWRSSRDFESVQYESPISLEEAVSTPADELVRRLKDWRQEHPYDEPSEWGLLAILETAARQQTARFLSKIERYRALAPNRYLAVLQGCFRGGIDGNELNWALLLAETEISIREVILPAARAASEAESAENLGIEIIRSLENTMTGESPRLPIECREAAWRCICEFLEHPDPVSDHDAKDSPRDLSSTFLNTSRLSAMRSIFSYANWVRKSLGASPDENPAVEILEVLNVRLRSEQTLAGRGVFGERLSWLIHFHREWLETRLPSLFPTNPDRRAERDAVWNCFITTSRASVSGMEVLRLEYERAIDECAIQSDETEASQERRGPEKSLVHHLCVFYWWGLLPLREPSTLLSRFYEVAPVHLRRHLLSYLGKSLRSTKGEVSEEIAQRFRELMDWRIDELGQSDDSPEQREELRGYLRWMGAQQIPAQWSLETLLRVLELAPRSNEYGDYLVIDAMAAYSGILPELTNKCLHKLMMADQERTPDWWGKEDGIRTILRNGFASDNPAVKDLAAEMQDHLLQLGRLQFRDLESNPCKGDCQ